MNNEQKEYVRIVTDLVNSKSWIDKTVIIPDLANCFVFKDQNFITRNKKIKISEDETTLQIDEDIILLNTKNYRLMKVEAMQDQDGVSLFKIVSTKQRGYIDDLSKFIFFKSERVPNCIYIIAVRGDYTEFFIDNIENNIVKAVFDAFFSSGKPISNVAQTISDSVLYFRAFGGFLVEYLPVDSLDSFVHNAYVEKGDLKAILIDGTGSLPVFNSFCVDTPPDIISMIKSNTSNNINEIIRGKMDYQSPEKGFLIKKAQNSHLHSDIMKFFNDIKINKSTNAPLANIQINNVHPTITYNQNAILCILHELTTLTEHRDNIIYFANGIEDLFDNKIYYFNESVDLYDNTTNVLSDLLKELDKLRLYRQQQKLNIVFAFKSLIQRELDSLRANIRIRCNFVKEDEVINDVQIIGDEQTEISDSLVVFSNFPNSLDEKVVKKVLTAVISNSIKNWNVDIQNMIDVIIRPNTDDQVKDNFVNALVNPKEMTLEAMRNAINTDDLNTAIEIIKNIDVVSSDISKNFDTALFSQNHALEKVKRYDWEHEEGNAGYEDCWKKIYKNGRFELASSVDELKDVRITTLGNNIKVDFDIPTRAVVVMAPGDNSTSKSITEAIDVYNSICNKAWLYIGKDETSKGQLVKSYVTKRLEELFIGNCHFKLNQISYYMYQYKQNFPESSYRNFGEHRWENKRNAYEHDCHIENRIKVSISIKIDTKRIQIDSKTGYDKKVAEFMNYLLSEFEIDDKTLSSVDLILERYNEDTADKLQVVVDNFKDKQVLIDFIKIHDNTSDKSAIFTTDLYGRKRLLDKEYLSILPFNVGNNDQTRRINTPTSSIDYNDLYLNDEYKLGKILDMLGSESCYNSPYKMISINESEGTVEQVRDVMLSMFIDSL